MPSKKKTKRKAAAFKQQANKNAGSVGHNPPVRKPSDNTLIIAIDFGTTFTGVAWYNIASNKQHHHRDWPNNPSSDNSKVPTVLKYTSEGKPPEWGHIRSSTSRLEWFKLLLNEGDYTTSADLLHRIETKGLNGYRESRNTNLANLRTTIKTIPEGKKPADLAKDYLTLVYGHVQSRIKTSFPALKEQLEKEGGVEIKCYLTVPAIWDDKGKEITKQAAIDAGMPEKQIYLISEPEAAAVHCLTDLEDEMEGNLKIGDVYVIVDCGGGTVDLISYEVTSTEPLRVRECTIGSGGLYGSTLLNRRFEELVISRIGQEVFDNVMDDYDRQVMRKDFEKEIKPNFLPDEDGGDDDFGVTCELPGVELENIKGVKKRKIEFTTKELKEIFKPTFTEITKLVQQQVDAAQEAVKKNVNHIILVGGFGSSQYLANWLSSNIRNKDGNKINQIRPEEPAIAIVLGALKHGVHMHQAGTTSEWGIVESRKARCSYGTNVAEPFRFGVHPLSKLAMDPFQGMPICIGRMEWLIRRGDDMRQGASISCELYRRCPIVDSEEAQKGLLEIEEEIYASAEDIAPADLEHPSVYRRLKYTADLSNIPRTCFIKRRSMVDSELQYWMIPGTIHLKLESAELCFTTMVGKHECGGAKDVYHHEPTSKKPQADEQRPRWGYCHHHGTVFRLGDNGECEEHGIEDETEVTDW